MSNNFSTNHRVPGGQKVFIQIRPKFQFTIPATLRESLDLKVGDLVEMDLIELKGNHALVIVPKRVVKKKINKKNN